MHGLGRILSSAGANFAPSVSIESAFASRSTVTRCVEALEREVGDPDFCATFIRTRPHLFSNVPVFLSESDVAAMLRDRARSRGRRAIARLSRAALSWAPEIARRDIGPLGVFMGYDFHLAGDGPKLIEVNTNAGGAFLNALLVQAQRACCAEVEAALTQIRKQ